MKAGNASQKRRFARSVRSQYGQDSPTDDVHVEVSEYGPTIWIGKLEPPNLYFQSAPILCLQSNHA
jgi:hypothetical protein